MPVADSVVGAMECIFDIAQDDVEPFKHPAIGIAAILIGDHLVMSAARCRYSRKTTQAIRKDRTFWPDIFDASGRNLLQRKLLHLVQLDE